MSHTNNKEEQEWEVQARKIFANELIEQRFTDKFMEFIHQELQKARAEERERIEAIFKEHVPPHAMDLEDSVWLKRLLNKAFNHDKNVW